jgi:NADPH-dependent 2,4-dienoyl-CoA reductase/sulfur reductase-like enzyme/nitrite reductase/ring-hydroxylating ferredoxin subunit
MGGTTELTGPDLEKGVPAASVPDGGMLLGHAGGEAVLLARRGKSLLAIGATCSHYSGNLADGILVGDEVRCPLHHACFDLRTGQASSPAFRPVPCWKLEERGADVFVVGKAAEPQPPAVPRDAPKRVVILGGGAAGHAAVETLRAEGYDGSIVLLSADDSPPYDRPNVSKDYLAGTAPEEWMPMRPADSYATDRIELRVGTTASSIDTGAKAVVLTNGDRVPFDALLVATGATPTPLTIPGSDLPHVAYVRTLKDSRTIIERCKKARRVVVVGASFIGLEVTAALRARNLEVHVVAPHAPLVRALGPEVSDFLQKLYESHGVIFHIGETPARITADSVELASGASLSAELVVAGVGVRPSISLAQAAGLAVDDGIVVNDHLETSVPGIFAAGDVARWPDAHTPRKLRVEHWVVAQRQGQTAARNILGQAKRYAEVPFFWSQHYDVAINYVGHAEQIEGIQRVGELSAKSCLLAYREAGRIAAVATIGRDRDSLRAEELLARNDQPALEELIRSSI